MHRASRDDSLHSNKSLTLFRNYQRTVLAQGVALLLATPGHAYQLLTRPAAPTRPGVLTDGLAFSKPDGCVRFARSPQASVVSLNLTTAAEARLIAPFRLASGFRAYFLALERVGATIPSAVSVRCFLRPHLDSAAADAVVLRAVTQYPSDGKMVIFDAHLPNHDIEANVCEFQIEHSAGDVLLAEVEVYE